MAPPSKDKVKLVDAEFFEEVDEKCSQQPNEPPSYAVATGPSSKPYPNDSSNKSNGNSLALAFSQPPHGPYYGYTNLEPTIDQNSIPGGISAVSIGRPTFSMPGTGLPAASGQHLIINQYGAYYCPPVETQRQNVIASRRASQPNPPVRTWDNCCRFLLWLYVVTVVCLFGLVILIGIALRNH